MDPAGIFNSNVLRAAAYIVAAALCLVAGLREREARRGTASLVPVFWFALAALMLFFGVSRVLEIGPEVTTLGRRFARDRGWYDERRHYQRPVVDIIFFGGLALVGAGWIWFFRTVYRERPLAFIAVVYIVTFVAIRTVSLHQVDHFLYTDHFSGYRPNAALELFGCALMGVATLPLLMRRARRL
jgi:drug/metabolite transporter (DMT)-like permease